MKGISCLALTIVGFFCVPTTAQVTLLSYGVDLLGDTAQFEFTFSEPVSIGETTPCIFDKFLLLLDPTDPSRNTYRPVYPGYCQEVINSTTVTANIDPRDFAAALEGGQFSNRMSTYIITAEGAVVNFLPLVDLAPISPPILPSAWTVNTENPRMVAFDVDLANSMVRLHFSNLMDLSSFLSTALTLVDGDASHTLTSETRPIGIEMNLVKTVCVTLSADDAEALKSMGICTERYRGCSCTFTSALAVDYTALSVMDVAPDNPLLVSKLQSVPMPEEMPAEIFMRLELEYIGCSAAYTLAVDEVYIARPREYVTRISCYVSGELDNAWPRIVFGVGREFRDDPTRSREMTSLQFSGGLREGYFGLYTCATERYEIQHFIIDNESPWIGFPEGMSYSARLYDSITIPFFYGSDPSINISDSGVEILLFAARAFPDPVHRKVSPYKGEIHYWLAPNSIMGTYTVRVLIGTVPLIESGDISISITPPSVEITPSALALLPSDTEISLRCVTNNPSLLTFWARYTPDNDPPAIVSTMPSYTTLIPSQGGFRDETRFVCGVRDPENPDSSIDNSEQQNEAVVTNIPMPLSVYQNGEIVGDQQEIVVVNQLSGSLSLRCLGHAPTNILDLVWVSERQGTNRVTLDPDDNEGNIRVWYSYNEANITIDNSMEPYRGTLRCLSRRANVQRTVFVVNATVAGTSRMCVDGDKDKTYGISWTQTKAGATDVQPCPDINGESVNGSGASGFAYRKCGDNGEWEMSVDVTNCMSDVFVNLITNAEDLASRFNGLNATVQNNEIYALTNTLKNLSSPRENGLFPQDLSASNAVVQAIVERLTADSGRMTIYGIVSIFDNLLQEGNLGGWLQLNRMTANANGGLALLQNIERFGAVVRDTRLNDTTMEVNLEGTYFFMCAQRVSGTPTDVQFPNSSHALSREAYVKIPASVLMEQSATSVVSIATRNLQDIAPQPSPSDVNSTRITRVGSVILSVQISPAPSVGSVFVSGVLEFCYTTTRLIRTSNPVCVFWNAVSSEWDKTGVMTVDISKGETGEYKTFNVKCKSNHSTSFAIIVDQETEAFRFTIPVYVGCGVIIFSAFMSIFCFIFSCCLDTLWQYSVSPYFTHMSFCVSLICSSVVFLAGLDLALQNMMGCIATAAILQYFFTAAFAWLFCETLVLVFFPWISRNCSSFFLLFFIGWGLPVIPTAISAGFLHNEYGATTHCWFFFDGEFSVAVVLSFIVPKLAIIALILIFLTVACCTFYTRSQELIKGQKKTHIHMLRFMWFSVFLLLLLLCGSWVFGMLNVNVYGLDFSLTGWIFMGISIALGIWLFFFSVIVSILNQKSDYEVLWETVDGSKTVHRKELKEKSGYFVGFKVPMNQISPNSLNYDSELRISSLPSGGKINPLINNDSEEEDI